MAVPPLTLTALRLSPYTCFPPTTSSTTLLPSYDPVPPSPIPTPSPPADFQLSPSAHYPAPFGTISLGSTLTAHLRLSNSSDAGVRGVKMMVEVQGPSGRYRLGEVIHRGGEGGRQIEEKGTADDMAPGGDGGKVAKGGNVDGVDADTAGRAHAGEAEVEPTSATEGNGFEDEPILPVGDHVELDVEAEMKDLGVNILICSVAWETPEGRRTFQRFFKFNVTPPLAIKTRIHTPSSPSALLDPRRRSEIYLEVLMQNTSLTGLAFDKVMIEPVRGMSSRSAGFDHSIMSDRTTGQSELPPSIRLLGDKEGKEEGGIDEIGRSTGNGKGKGKAKRAFQDDETLYPDDTRQYIFVLSPEAITSVDRKSESKGDKDDTLPLSTFPPIYAPGTILPLGRLDVSWFSAPYRDPGRLQTSTLNRRVPMVPITPAGSGAAGLGHPGGSGRTSGSVSGPGAVTVPAPAPTRTSSAAPPIPASTANQNRPLPPDPGAFDLSKHSSKDKASPSDWEYDLVILDIDRTVEVEQEFTAKLRIAARSSAHVNPDHESNNPPSLHLALQYLSNPPPHHTSTSPAIPPAMTLSGPSRSSSPLSSSLPASTGLHRPLSPASLPSRSLTPVSSQLRQAASSNLRPLANGIGGTSAPGTPIPRTPGSTSTPLPDVPRDESFIADFPPEPYLTPFQLPPPPNTLASALNSVTGANPNQGEVFPLGNSLTILPAKSASLVRENTGSLIIPTSPRVADSAEKQGGAEASLHKRDTRTRWEVTHEVELRFVPLEEGLASLGGVRILLLDRDTDLDLDSDHPADQGQDHNEGRDREQRVNKGEGEGEGQSQSQPQVDGQRSQPQVDGQGSKDALMGVVAWEWDTLGDVLVI